MRKHQILGMIALTTSLIMGGVLVKENFNFNFSRISRTLGVECSTGKHSGNYYASHEATNETPGSVGYAVCCSCHEHIATSIDEDSHSNGDIVKNEQGSWVINKNSYGDGELKFKNKFSNDYLYKIGNLNAFSPSSIFGGATGLKMVGNPIAGNVSLTSNNEGTKFSGTGVVRVKPVYNNNSNTNDSIVLEVIKATNATSAIDVEGYNVVLLNNIGINGREHITVDNGYSLYANGFTIYCGSDGRTNAAMGLSSGYIKVANKSSIDNAKIIAPDFPKAYMYADSNSFDYYIRESENAIDDSNHFKYQLAAVYLTNSSKLTNSYIYGGRCNILSNGGDITIDNCVLENGALANIHHNTQTGSLNLNNVTTSQKLRAVDYHKCVNYVEESTVTTNYVNGYGILMGPSPDSSVTVTSNSVLNITGTFNQYNWVCEDDFNYDNFSSKMAKKVFQSAIKQEAYIHTVDSKDYINAGVVYLNKALPTINDNSTRIDDYVLNSISLTGANGQVYSIKSDKGTVEYQKEITYSPTANAPYIPVVAIKDTVSTQSLEAGTDGVWTSDGCLNISFIRNKSYAIKPLELIEYTRYGSESNVTFSCDIAMNKDDELIFNSPGSSSIVFTITGEKQYDLNGQLIDGSLFYSLVIPVSVTKVNDQIKSAEITIDTNPNLTGLKMPSSSDRYYWFDIFDGLTLKDYKDDGTIETLLDSSDTSTKKLFIDKIIAFDPEDLVLLEGDYTLESTLKMTLLDGRVLKMSFVRNGGVTNSPGGTKKVLIKTNSSKTSLYYVTNSGASSNGVNTAINNQTFAHGYTIKDYVFTGRNGASITGVGSHVVASGLYNKVWTEPTYDTKPSNSISLATALLFNAKGGTMDEDNYSQNNPATLPSAYKEGYVFAGWSMNEDGSGTLKKPGELYSYSSTTTLYAKWVKESVISFNSLGGTCAVSSTNNSETGFITLPEVSNGDLTFMGWYDAEAGGIYIGSIGDKYEPSGNINLYARWTSNPKIIFNAGEGQLNSGTVPFAIYDGVTPITLPTASREGYNFTGWYSLSSGGDLIGMNGESYCPSSSGTIYAHWEIKTFTVTITCGNNGTVSTNIVKNVPFGTTFSSDNNTMTFNTTPSTSVTASPSNNYSTSWDPEEGTITDDTTISVTFNQSCLTKDSMVTLSNKSKVKIDSLSVGDEIQTFDHLNGCLSASKIAYIYKSYGEFNKLKINFNNNVSIDIVEAHCFYSLEDNRYIEINTSNVASCIGKHFYNTDSKSFVKLTSFSIEHAEDYTYSILTEYDINHVANGFLALSNEIEGLYNYFDYDKNMKYDEVKMQEDINTYGLASYDDFKDYCTEYEFEVFNCKYLNISVGKGLTTFESLIERMLRFTGKSA